MDSEDFALAAIAIVILAVCVGLIGNVISSSMRFDKWESECRTQSGLVVKTSDSRYECNINGKFEKLRGYENE